MRRATLGLLLAFTLLSGHASADFLDSISNGISSATSAVSSGLGTATNAVGSGVSTAVGAVGSGIGTAVNATTSGVNTALNATSRWVSTATGSIRDAYNVSRETVENFTSSVQTALAPAAGVVSNTADNLGNQIYNVSSGTYQGIVNYRSPSTPSQSGNAPVGGPATTQDTTVDATNATSIINAISTNSSGFIGVANSLLVALGQERSSAVENGIKNVINNSTGNTTYPAEGPNNTISLGLAQAVVTAIVTANNYSVTVQYQGATNQVNASEVADVFLAGLQDALTPCARNASTTTNATAGSETYFRTIASDCCFLVAQPLTYVSALCQSNGVGGVFQDALSQSQLLGQNPSLDLTRCLSNQTSIA